MACRSLVFRTSLYANILPPGVNNNAKTTAHSFKSNHRDHHLHSGYSELESVEHEQIVQRHAMQDGINIDDIIHFGDAHTHDDNQNNDIIYGWNNSGRHPLFKLLKARHHREGGKLVIPEKKSSVKKGDIMFKKHVDKTFVAPALSDDLTQYDSEEVSQHVARYEVTISIQVYIFTGTHLCRFFLIFSYDKKTTTGLYICVFFFTL
jgi:hypothetical protein